MALVVRATSNSTFKIVPFINGYKAFIADTIGSRDIFHIYGSNGYFGIGTDNPKERLEIKNGIIRVTNNDTNPYININNNGLSFNNSNSIRKGFIGIDNVSNYIQMTNENGMKGFVFNGELLMNEMRPEVDKWHRSIDGNPRLYFSSNSRSYYGSSNGYQWNDSSNNGILYLSNNGNLGIGISNPKANIHVTSTINQFPLKISTNSTNSNGTFISLNTDDVSWCKCAIGHIKTGDFDIGDLLFLTRNSSDMTSVSLIDERMRIKSSGLIGIGITNPKANLHIHNSNSNQEVMIRISDAGMNKGLSLYKSSNDDSYLINNENTNLIIGSGSYNQREALKIDNSNNINIKNKLNFDCIANTEISITTPSYKSSFLYYNNSNINIGRDLGYGSTITTFHNNIITNSNIGIGVSPLERLHVNGTIASMTSDTRNYIRIFNDNSISYIDSGSANDGIAFRINNSGDLYGNTNFNERMRIKSNGNIGIGNNNPITNGNDTNLCIGDSSLLNSAGYLIIGKNSGSSFQRHFKLGYGDGNYMTLGDFGTSNNPGIWKQQVKIHWNSPISTLILYENGDANLYGQFYQNSDIKIKKDIKTIDNALMKVNQLNGVEYINIYDNSSYIGLIAQEVEPIVPHVVNYNQETDLKSVAYGNLTPLLINAIKELSEKIRILEEKL